MLDIREVIFADIVEKHFYAQVIVEGNGVLSGAKEAVECAKALDFEFTLHKKEGQAVLAGEVIADIVASPMAMALAEEKIIGKLSKASGIATATRQAVNLADGKIRIVAGAWKKMPEECKDMVRQAVTAGGAVFRITDNPMIYLDKNFIKMLNGIPTALQTVVKFSEYDKVVQIKGDLPIDVETKQAIDGGCTIFMVDTGKLADLDICLDTLRSANVRQDVKVAFAGGIKIDQISSLTNKDIDVFCVGKEIIDAPLLDMRLDVVK